MATGWTSSANQPTKLDQSKESLSLLSILRAYNRPVTEDQVWAILYQSAKTGLQCFNSANPPPRTTSRHNNNDIQSHQQHANNNIHNLTDKSENEVMTCYVVKRPYHIWIHRKGHVHPHSFEGGADSIEAERRTVAECQSQVVEGLFFAIYGALVYGFAEGKLPNLSPDLEQMIEFLMPADEGSDEGSDEGEGLSLDEGQSLGLNGDFGEAEDSAAAAAAASVSSTSTTSSSSASPAAAAAAAAFGTKSLSHIMDRCRMQISSTTSSDQADAHFREICRKLVAETLLHSAHSDYIVKVLSVPPEDWLTEHHRAVWKEEESRLIKEELERVREELRVQKELNEQLQEACDVMAKELECGICTQLMVFATSLNCMHTFCQHCIREWKKYKCHGGSGNSFKRI